jgi:arabinofuranan 3-O-arabinosyltransferase
MFGTLLLVGAAIMVGGHPPGSPSPFGELLFRTFDALPSLKAFRGTYKAGAVLALGLAGLVGIGVAAVFRRLPNRTWRITGGVLAAILFCVATFPFWTGSLYRTKESLAAIPQYYRDATAWLDRQSGEGRVLVLPSTSEAVYTWGAAGDDIIDSLLERPHIVRAQVDTQMGTAQAANLLAAVDDYVNSGEYQPGILAPIARRLGIRYVMLRNDLDWAAIGRPAPSRFDALRSDPELHLQATFGHPGQGVRRGKSPRARQADAQRPPVEIFEVDGPRALARVSRGPELLVSGDGAAWPMLARDGFLSDTGPVRYTGDLSHEELAQTLRAGAGVVITDTNLRRVQTIPGASDLANSSPPLSASENIQGRDVQDLFNRAESESVAWYPDATRISASSYGNRFGVVQPDARPANAFDGVAFSSWLTGGFGTDVVGEWVRADFKAPHAIDGLRIVLPSTRPGRRAVSKVRIDFSDGSRVNTSLTGTTTDVAFRSRTTRSLRVTITGVRGAGTRAVGIADIGILGLDLREGIQLPTDVARAAESGGRVASALAEAPLSYQFGRLGRVIPSGLPRENELHRTFRTPFATGYRLTGSLRLSPGDPDVRGQLPADACRNDVVSVDNAPVPVRMEGGTPTETEASDRTSVGFIACEPVELEPGWHRLDNALGVGVDTVLMATGPSTEPAIVDAAHTLTRSGGDVSVRGDAGTRSSIVIGESYDSNWRGRIGRHDLGRPIALDTQTAWALPAEGRFTLTADFGPERVYMAALAVTALGIVLCLVLALCPDRVRRGFINRLHRKPWPR